MPDSRRPTALLIHPSAELYGSDRVALESAVALIGRGWAVQAVLGAEGPLRARLEAAGARVEILDSPVLRKSLLSPLGLLRLAAHTARATAPMLRLLRLVRPDIVYVSTVTVPWWLVLARLDRLARPDRLAGRGRIRVVCHVHEAEQDVPRMVRAGLAAPLLCAHTVIANSEVSASVLTGALPVLARRTRVVYNGVPGPATVSPPRTELAGPVRLVLVGRVSPRKGTDVAVRALGLLRDGGTAASLDLVGGVFAGYEWFEAEVRALADELGVTDAVTWRGVLDDIWPALAGADIALVPSRVEPFGNAAVEGMLAGRPVVAGAAQGLREIVRPGDNGELAEPGDAASLAGAVLRLVSDWPGALKRADAARVEAEERFSPAGYRRTLAAAVIGTS